MNRAIFFFFLHSFIHTIIISHLFIQPICHSTVLYLPLFSLTRFIKSYKRFYLISAKLTWHVHVHMPSNLKLRSGSGFQQVSINSGNFMNFYEVCDACHVDSDRVDIWDGDIMSEWNYHTCIEVSILLVSFVEQSVGRITGLVIKAWYIYRPVT